MSQESKRSLLSFEGSANVVIKNITLKNSHGETKGDAQAETIGVGASSFTGTLAAYNCSFLSGQDTICTEGKAWFYKCYIEGDVDFLWIESKDGKVALYEECIIRAIGSRTTKAYYTAPRLAPTNSVGKGVVIWKSRLEAEDALKEVYLGRNPWDRETDEKKNTNYFNDYYEQVAVIDTKFYSNNELNSNIWSGSGAHGTPNQQFVGFKTCQKFTAPSPNDCGAVVLTAEQVAAEYSSRNYILNRVYNIEKKQFENDYPIWNFSALETEFGAERSEALPVSPTIIEWSQSTNFTKDSDVLFDKGSFINHENKGVYLKGNTNEQLSFYVVSDCTVTVSLFYSGEASVACNGKSVDGTKSDPIVLELTGIDTPKKVTVTALADNTYIESVKVKYATNVDNDLEALRTRLKNPLAGETYTYNLCDPSNLKDSGSTKDGFFAWGGASPASGHGLQGGNGTLKVAGNVKIIFGGCAFGSGKITIKNGDTELSVLTTAKKDTCCAKGKTPDFTKSDSYDYTGEAAELSLEWEGSVYLEGIKVEPLNN